MYFNKWPHPANFQFLSSFEAGTQRRRPGLAGLRVELRRYQGDLYRIRVVDARWKKNYSQAGLTRPPPVRWDDRRGLTRFDVRRGGGLTLRDRQGRTLLSSPSGMTVGVCGPASMFLFEHTPDMQFYGMGEKVLGFELSGVQTKFWNTDVFADFYGHQIFEGRPDPLYVSIPYLIIKRGNTYLGLLLDNPFATFMHTGARIDIAGQMKLSGVSRQRVVMGAEQGQPDLYIIVGPSLAELTRKMQRLVGRTPLPPVWALGYHQCRWGYRSAADLERLDRRFRKHGIPCDGLWLDIDYMEKFKVFTFNRAHFPSVERTLRRLKKCGRRVIPILDPGVKKDPGFPVYAGGRRAGVFCRNPQGGEFTGLVWPGETAFPDFSRPEGRRWWAGHVKQFAARGFEGVWIDMNDPSTGSVQNDAMRFDRGREAHDVFHNQFASGMAAATRAGLEAAHPNRRVFVISRSGYTGISRNSALWTGDNVSNYHHLRNAIPCSLNLALSGVPFNGPDIGGFCGDCPPGLLMDWMKACFLFPFCRNHTMSGTRPQEPWAYGPRVLGVLRHYIRMRYKLRPYLYQLFVRQAGEGEAILRPLFYDFEDTERLPLGKVDDQFMVGPAILQAPIVHEKERAREVVLPGANAWYSAMDGRWLAGGRRVQVRPGPRQTPLYFREGAVVPMTPGVPEDNRYDGRRVEWHLFVRPRPTAAVEQEYVVDDGETLDCQRGRRSRVRIHVAAKPGLLDIRTLPLERGYGAVKFDFIGYAPFALVRVNGRARPVRPFAWDLAGTRVKAWRIEE